MLDTIILPEPSRIMNDVAPNSRRAVTQTIAKQIALDLNRHPAGMIDALLPLAGSSVTPIGAGVAVIDACLDGLDAPYLLVARTVHKIDFNADDHKPVDLIAVLLSPSGARIPHIRLTGRLTRMLHDPRFCDAWRGANSVDAVYALFTLPFDGGYIEPHRKVA